jgi:regulator of sigma E protease
MTVFWFIVVIGILVFVHEVGHFIFARLMNVRVLKFSLGFGPKLLGKKIGDTEYLISAIPLGGYVKMLGEEPGEELKEENKPYAYNYKPVWQRALIVFAGSVFNFLLAYIIFMGVLAQGLPINIPTVKGIMPVLEDIEPDSPAEKAGLKKGDIVTAVDGHDVSTWMDMTAIIMKSPGKELTMKVKRGTEEIGVKIIPRIVEVKDTKGEVHKIGRIGVIRQSAIKTVTGGLLNAPVNAVKAVYYWSSVIVESIVKLIKGEVSAQNIGGPILIGKMSGEAASFGALAFLMFISIISINLAVLNLLPIPILDGGHLLFLGIEAIRKKPLSEKAIMIAHRIGLAVIITLMVFAMYNDIFRLISGKPLP